MDYGFTLPECVNENSYNDFQNKYRTTLSRRRVRWNGIQSSYNFNKKSRKLKRFIRKGIPNDLREEVWMKCSGAEKEMSSNEGLYNELLNRELDPIVLKAISADISRTFPENANYKINQNSSNKIKSLERILKAFAIHNFTIGYCQGLNYVAALLLLIISSEEKAFWLFHTLITKLVQPYYNPGMQSVQIDCYVFEQLLRMKIPKVHQSIKNLGTSCIAMCTKWFVCLYIDVLPIETAIRILDCLIYEGDKMLFRVAISLIKTNHKDFISAQTFPEFALCFRKVVNNENVVDCHHFMEAVFKQSNPLSYKSIIKLRKQGLSKLDTILITN